MKYLTTIICAILVIGQISAQEGSTIRLGLLKYRGGGDWYANPTSLPNLVEYANKNYNMNIQKQINPVEVGSPEIFSYPFVHMTGHGNVKFSDDEVANLRKYLLSGGFLHIDDNYGIDKSVRREMKKVFPELDFVELPAEHEIYKEPNYFAKGLPKIHEHDNKPAQGFGLIYENRLICFYTYECDLGDGWEDKEIHNDSEETRQKALKMGMNILQYVFSN